MGAKSQHAPACSRPKRCLRRGPRAPRAAPSAGWRRPRFGSSMGPLPAALPDGGGDGQDGRAVRKAAGGPPSRLVRGITDLLRRVARVAARGQTPGQRPRSDRAPILTVPVGASRRPGGPESGRAGIPTLRRAPGAGAAALGGLAQVTRASSSNRRNGRRDSSAQSPAPRAAASRRADVRPRAAARAPGPDQSGPDQGLRA